MFVHRPIALGIASSLKSIFHDGWLADREIEKVFKDNKKWGAKDRAGFAQTVYDVTRFFRRYAHAAGYDSSQHYSNIGFYLDLVQAYFLINNIDTNLEFKNGKSKAELLKKWNESTSPAIHFSVPDWLYEFGVSQLGVERWEDQLKSMNVEAPLFIRTNELKIKREDLITALKGESIEAQKVEGSDIALQLPRSKVFTTNSFKQGYFEIQDVHSQVIAQVLDAKPGDRVIDACAGGGGKTLHIAAFMKNKGQIIALDTVEKKLVQLKLRARRAGVNNTEIRVIESSKDIKRLKESADKLLLDVPCSGTGVYRRNPDARWHLSPEKLEELKKTQLQILTNYSSMLKPKGVLVYSTCSIFPDENNNIIKQFMSQNETQFTLIEEHQLWCKADGGDGFYFAKLIKN